MRWDLLSRYILTSPLLRHTVFFSWSVAAGLAFGYSIPPKLFPGIEWIGFVPFLLLLLFPMKRGALFFYGGISFSVATALYTSWMLDAYPLSWLNLPDSWSSFLLTLGAWFAVFSVPGLAGGIFLVVAKKLLRNNFLDVIRLGLLIAAMDYIRTFLAAWHPFLLGSGSIYGDNWATNILGYSIAEYDALRQLSSIGGLYFLSFIALLPSALIFLWLRAFRQNGAAVFSSPGSARTEIYASFLVAILFGIFIIGGHALAGWWYTPESTLQVAVVSSNFTPEDWLVSGFPARSSNILTELIRQAARADSPADVILLPEGSALAATTAPDIASYGPVVQSLTGGREGQLLVNLFPRSYPDGSGRPATNDIYVLEASGATLGAYAKQFLMPFGEYMPYVFDKVGRLAGFSQWLDHQAGPSYTSGKEHNGVFKTRLGSLGILGCSEIISPYVSRIAVKNGAEVLLYTASIGILRGSERLRAQNLAIAQIRAAETRRFVAYATNGGHSFFVGPDGTVLWENPAVAPGVKMVEARTNAVLTPAVKYENWFSFFAIAALLADGAYTAVARRRGAL